MINSIITCGNKSSITARIIYANVSTLHSASAPSHKEVLSIGQPTVTRTSAGIPSHRCHGTTSPDIGKYGIQRRHDIIRQRTLPHAIQVGLKLLQTGGANNHGVSVAAAEDTVVYRPPKRCCMAADATLGHGAEGLVCGGDDGGLQVPLGLYAAHAVLRCGKISVSSCERPRLRKGAYGLVPSPAWLPLLVTASEKAPRSRAIHVKGHPVLRRTGKSSISPPRTATLYCP